MRTLTENREILDRIVNVLLEKETIGSEELDRLVNGEPEPPSLDAKRTAGTDCSNSRCDVGRREGKKMRLRWWPAAWLAGA
jgi:hypothetical protein